ncbi:MAG TPA: hypothetical protein VGK89_02130 [Candidatus Eisenbacteria bacterium]|jgi:hypothetical protein
MIRTAAARVREPRRIRARALALALLLVWASGARAAPGVRSLLEPGSRAAPGLGGDPFRSPLRDECGWWSEPGFAAGPEVRLQSFASEPLTSRATRGGGSLRFGETSWRLLGATRVAGRPLALAGQLSAPRWTGTLAAAGGELRFSGAGSRAEAGLRVNDLLPGLSAQAAGPLWIEGGGRQAASLGAGLRYRPRTWLAAQASWQAARMPEALTSDLYGEPLAASLNLRSEQRRLDARLVVRPGLALESSVARTRYAPNAARTPALRYEVMPAGTSRMDQASAEAGLGRGLEALARWTRSGFELAGDALWGGERFGQLNYADATLESRLVALEARTRRGGRWLLDAERVRARARARFVLESWPFTSTLVDLLGLRRIGRLNAEVEWHRFHAGIDRPVGAAGRAQLGLAWYDVAPAGSVESWRPLFLVFGRTDDRTDRLGFRRAQLAAVSLGGTWRLGGIESAIALEQFVFAKAFSVPVNPAAPASPSGDPAGAAGAFTGGAQARGWPGGTRVEFSLSRRL